MHLPLTKRYLYEMRVGQIIDVDNSINSGQVFLWRKNNSCWYGINGPRYSAHRKKWKNSFLSEFEGGFF